MLTFFNHQHSDDDNSRSILPSNLIELNLSRDFNQKISIGSIPKSVKKLVFGNRFNQEIEKNALPRYLTDLEFQQINSTPIFKKAIDNINEQDNSFLPKTLVNLKVLSRIEKEWFENYIAPLLKESIEKLNLRGIVYNNREFQNYQEYKECESVKKDGKRESYLSIKHLNIINELPKYIDSIYFSGVADEEVPCPPEPTLPIIIPDHIKKIKVSSEIAMMLLFPTKPIRNSATLPTWNIEIPPNVKKIALNIPPNNNITIPPTVEKISFLFGYGKNEPIPKGLIPSTVRKVSVNYHSHLLAIPPTVTEVTIRFRDYRDFHVKSIPPTIRYLKFSSKNSIPVHWSELCKTTLPFLHSIFNIDYYNRNPSIPIPQLQ
eukprot:gene11393-13953_t